MKVSHVHATVKDLPAALEWLENVFEIRPTFKNDQMASIPLGAFVVILDRGEQDWPLTIGFETDDCDRDFDRAVSRGAAPIQAPSNKAWGVRAGYIKGPGCIRFEYEQGLKN